MSDDDETVTIDDSVVAKAALSEVDEDDEVLAERDNFLTRCDVSSRYDTCIVYALDECLTRGTYRVFAQWLRHYLARENLPGCLTVVGFSNRRARTATDGACTEGRLPRDTVNLGGRGTADSSEIPYVRLNPNDRYSIFDFKRQTGYPAIVLLVTLPASRMELCLSCDGAILVHARHTLRRNMMEVADVLRHLNREYLDDLYTRVNVSIDGDDGENNCIGAAVDTAATVGNSGGCLIGFEQRRDNDEILEISAADTDAATADIVMTDNAAEITNDQSSVSAMSQWWEPARQPPIECADERWEDRFSNERTNVSISAIVDRPARLHDGGDHRHNDAVARLHVHNRTLLNDLKRMDATLTNTHPIDILPVVHGESIDIVAGV